MDADELMSIPDSARVWVENFRGGPSLFRAADQRGYAMAAHGMLGSVVEVPVSVAKASYVRRAADRGLLRILDEEEARTRMADLAPT
jgi:hypothetical protein